MVGKKILYAHSVNPPPPPPPPPAQCAKRNHPWSRFAIMYMYVASGLRVLDAIKCWDRNPFYPCVSCIVSSMQAYVLVSHSEPGVKSDWKNNYKKKIMVRNLYVRSVKISPLLPNMLGRQKAKKQLYYQVYTTTEDCLLADTTRRVCFVP